MRVLLLNPPGRRTYIRDYSCSKTTKSNYLFHPIDLVVLSGTVAARHDTAVLDCMAERLDPAAAERRIDTFAPEAIVSLVGAVSWLEDRAFLAAQAARGRRIVAIGDVLQEDAARRLAEEPWLEAILHHFATDGLLDWLDRTAPPVSAPEPSRSPRSPDAGSNRGLTVPVRAAGPHPAEPSESAGARSDAAAPPIPHLSYRTADGAPVVGEGAKLHGTYRVPRPRHELFPRTGYRFSFARAADFATVLTDYGCPWPCTFCVIGTLGFATRPVEDVLEEIDWLRARGTRELFFLDQTFGVVPRRGLELCAALASRGDLSWTAFTRPDTATDELLGAMRRAGCHTVILGVESASDAVLAATRKGYASAEVRAAFARARRHGLRTVGTFVIGLPEETPDSLERTLELACELQLDFMSVNVAVPRFGTAFRAQALALGLADRDDLVMDQGGAEAFLPTRTLDRAAVLALKKRMVRRFYLRPSYLWRRLRAVASLHELRAQLREGLALLARNV